MTGVVSRRDDGRAVDQISTARVVRRRRVAVDVQTGQVRGERGQEDIFDRVFEQRQVVVHDTLDSGDSVICMPMAVAPPSSLTSVLVEYFISNDTEKGEKLVHLLQIEIQLVLELNTCVGGVVE